MISRRVAYQFLTSICVFVERNGPVENFVQKGGPNGSGLVP